MVAYSFRERFVRPIRKGLGLPNLNDFGVDLNVADSNLHPKRQTIRARGKRRHASPGDTLQLYTGMRTKKCALIGIARCVEVHSVQIEFDVEGLDHVTIGGTKTFSDIRSLDKFSIADGFKSWDAFLKFWEMEHPGVDRFDGVLIKWEPLQ